MIKLIKHGAYRLIETKRHTKILYLDGAAFAWIEPKKIGEILVSAVHNLARADYTLSRGHYNLYSVEDEPGYFDLDHLELETGEDSWQGYLLLSGLPDLHKKRGRIIPTFERITGNARPGSIASVMRTAS